MKNIFALSFISLSIFALSSCTVTVPVGEDGNGIVSIEKTNTQDNIDYYTITFTNGEKSSFTVTNGINGEQGIQGKPGKDGHTPIIKIGENGNWRIDDIDSGIKAQGPKGDKGDQGNPGKDGNTPYIGENGNWFIGGIDTGHPSKGANGQSTYLSINDKGYWVINGEITEYKAEGNCDKIYDAMSEYFDYKEIFVPEIETLKNPSFSYTTSTFSGWSGSIGKPKTINTIAFKVRAREKAISTIKVYVNKYDKNGENIFTETLNVNINPKEYQEVYWTLPIEYQNINNEPLYFGYACNAFCDVYSNFGSQATIPLEEYQAIQAYSTGGNQPDSLSKFTNVYQNPSRYIYVKLGKKKHAFVPNDKFNFNQEKINVFLPDKYYLAVNDNFQLFYRGVVQAVNPYNYYIKVNTKYGSIFPRYYERKPTIDQIGEHKLTLEIRDKNNNLLGSDTTTLVVNNAKKANENKNILCVGDSLTSSGLWVKEGYRRFTQTGGQPAGDGLNYINCVGTKKTVVNGTTIGYEGRGGWTWGTYLSEQSPFYDVETKQIDFKKYAKVNYFDNIDYFYILLTRNGHSSSFKTDFKFNEGHFLQAGKMIDRIHIDFPNAKVRCLGIQMPSQNGGMGTNYGTSSPYSDTYGMLVTAMNYNKTLEEFCKQSKYKDFVNYIDVAGQFDTDYNMPASQKPVNNRNEQTEIIGTNGVHPTTNGCLQIGDVFYRSLYNDFKE